MLVCSQYLILTAVLKGSDRISLVHVFAHPFPLNSGAPIASGKLQVSPYMGLLHHTNS